MTKSRPTVLSKVPRVFGNFKVFQEILLENCLNELNICNDHGRTTRNTSSRVPQLPKVGPFTEKMAKSRPTVLSKVPRILGNFKIFRKTPIQKCLNKSNMKNDDDRMSRNTSNHVPKFVAEDGGDGGNTILSAKQQFLTSRHFRSRRNFSAIQTFIYSSRADLSI